MPREVGLDDDFVVHAPDLLAGITPEDLAQAYLRGSAERPVPRVDLSHVTVDTVSVSEAVADAHRPARDRPGRGSFRAAGVASCQTRMDVIVRFLALLELCKMGRVTLGQGHDLRRSADRLAGRATSWPGCRAAAGLAELGGFESRRLRRMSEGR